MLLLYNRLWLFGLLLTRWLVTVTWNVVCIGGQSIFGFCFLPADQVLLEGFELDFFFRFAVLDSLEVRLSLVDSFCQASFVSFASFQQFLHQVVIVLVIAPSEDAPSLDLYPAFFEPRCLAAALQELLDRKEVWAVFLLRL